MPPASPQEGPLARLTVIETGGEIATRYCGRLFAAMGARVAQLDPHPIEAINACGEAGRLFLAWLDGNKQPAPDLASALKAAGGKPLVIAGQTPAAVQAIDADLAALGAECVRLGLTWFGDLGPYADWRGHDAVIQALAGVAFGFGMPEGPPVLPQGHAPQLLGGLVGFSGALGALMGGPAGPRRVDVNVFETAMCFSEIGAITLAYAPELRSGRNGINRYTPTFPSSIYETADGYVGVTALTPAQWASLCELMVDPEWAAAFSFFTSLERLGCADEIDAMLIPLFAEKPTAYWVEAGDRLRIPITSVPRPGELPGMAHWSGRGSFESVSGDVSAPSLPFRIGFDGVASLRPVGGGAGPLSGVRVADFSMGWAGPLGARYLADLGADVLKIESRTKPDWWRGWEIVEAQDPPLHELARNFMAVNRSKRGLDLDLASPEGKAAAQAIIQRCDIVIDNQGPGVMDRLGLGQADQRRLRPGVISVAMPPFGRGGPLSGLRAYGSTVEQASGMPFVNGLAEWPPSMQHVAYGDPVAGLYAAAAALAALYARERLGGAEIDLCQVECLFQLAADAIIADQTDGLVRAGSRRPGEAPVCVVPARGEEEAWLAVAVDGDKAWGALCAELADPALSPAWSLSERRTREDEIEAAIARWAADQPTDQAAARLQRAGIPAAPVLATHELWRNPHLEASGYWAVQHRRYLGEHMTPRPTFRFDGERPSLTNPAPTLGEHTDEALASL